MPISRGTYSGETRSKQNRKQACAEGTDASDAVTVDVTKDVERLLPVLEGEALQHAPAGAVLQKDREPF